MITLMLSFLLIEERAGINQTLLLYLVNKGIYKILLMCLLQKGGALFESGASCVIFIFY